MRRLIYAWNYREWGGAQIHFLGLIREARKFYDVSVVLPAGTSAEFFRLMDAQGISYVTFEPAIDATASNGVISKVRRHFLKAKSEYAMLKCIAEIGLDETMVHTDLLPTQSLFSLVWLCSRTDVFITSHNALPPVPSWRWILWKLKFRIISLFDTYHVFCTNEHAARYFSKLYSYRIADKIEITYDSINPEEIQAAMSEPIDRLAELGRFDVPVDKFIVLAVGQFIDRKGRWIFLDSAKMIANADNDLVFIWIMPQGMSETDKQRVASYDLDGAFFPIVSESVSKNRHGILKFFRTADVFALPSFVEGIPISLLEAMALGIPSISTNVYGIPEAIVDGKTGLLVEAGNATELANAILRLKDDPGLRNRIAATGREVVLDRFDERKAARTAVAAYQRVSDK